MSSICDRLAGPLAGQSTPMPTARKTYPAKTPAPRQRRSHAESSSEMRRRLFLQLNFCVLRGMAIYDTLNTPKDDNEAVLGLWISMAKMHLEANNTGSTDPLAWRNQYVNGAWRTLEDARRVGSSRVVKYLMASECRDALQMGFVLWAIHRR